MSEILAYNAITGSCLLAVTHAGLVKAGAVYREWAAIITPVVVLMAGDITVD